LIFCIEDGQISSQTPQVSILDHGFLFGDSIYEVVRSYSGNLFGWKEHLDRFHQSAQRVGYDLSSIQAEIETRVEACRKYYEGKDAAIRVIVTRGLGKLHIDPRSCSQLSLFVAAWPLNQAQTPESMKIMIPKIRRNPLVALDLAIKSGNYLNSVLAFKEAVDAGYDDALFLNPEGFVTELTTSNVGWISKDRVFTPALSCGILHGITRQTLLRSLEVAEGEYTERELRQADEIFVISTLKEVVPVSEIRFLSGESKKFSDFSKSLQIREKLRHTIQRSLSTN